MRRPLGPYAVAVVLVTAAVLLQWVLAPWLGAPGSLLILCAVTAISVWHGVRYLIACAFVIAWGESMRRARAHAEARADRCDKYFADQRGR